jgi:hypothetical protein
MFSVVLICLLLSTYFFIKKKGLFAVYGQSQQFLGYIVTAGFIREENTDRYIMNPSVTSQTTIFKTLPNWWPFQKVIEYRFPCITFFFILIIISSILFAVKLSSSYKYLTCYNDLIYKFYYLAKGKQWINALLRCWY